jgi:hypothetical protein
MDEMFHEKWNIQKEKYKIDEKLQDTWKITQLGWKAKNLKLYMDESSRLRMNSWGGVAHTSIVQLSKNSKPLQLPWMLSIGKYGLDSLIFKSNLVPIIFLP